jgi:hypothetical protein
VEDPLVAMWKLDHEAEELDDPAVEDPKLVSIWGLPPDLTAHFLGAPEREADE